MAEIIKTEFRGQRNDTGAKFVGDDYFYLTENINQDDIVGFNKTLAPMELNKTSLGESIDGLIEYNYLNDENRLNTLNLIFCDGKIYQNFDNPQLIYEGMSKGIVKTAVLNDKLFIVNGVDYPLVFNGRNFWQMGAPEAVQTIESGVLSGSYYYAISYITNNNNEEVLGTISNTISVEGRKIKLNLPIGYSSTTKRKIYRTEAGGSELKFVAEIEDNTTLEYVDNLEDEELGDVMPEVNNECPRPKFIESNYFRLIGVGDEMYPTQAYVSDPNVEILDKANYIDVTNRAGDNSKITGLSKDYNLIIIASEKQIYTLDVSGETSSVTTTRANVGCKDGYSMVAVPAEGNFSGGVLFVSPDNTVRLLNGNYAQPIATSLDNIKTENWAQIISGSLAVDLQSYVNLSAVYYDFKYHLAVDKYIYVFDIRRLAWSILKFETENNLCNIRVLYTPNPTLLLVGRANGGFVERMYQKIKYKDEDLKASVIFPFWAVSSKQKYFRDLIIYFERATNLDIDVTIRVGEQQNSEFTTKINDTGGEDYGDYDRKYFSEFFYETGYASEDFREIHINQYGFWIQFEVTMPSKLTLIRGIQLVYDEISNKEMR